MAKFSGVSARLSAFTWRPVAACALMTGLAASAFWAHMELPAVGPQIDTSGYELAAAGMGPSIVEYSEFTGAIGWRSAPASRAGERTLNDATEQTTTAPTTIAQTAGAGLPAETANLTGNTLANAANQIAEVSNAQSVTIGGERANSRLETRTVTDPFERIERQDANRFSDLPPLVVQAGRDGEVTRVYRYVDGTEPAVGMAVLEIVASERQDEIVAIGTRERPAPTPFEGGSVTGDIPESVWVALAQCESGGRPSVISAGGRFHGLYQFSVATWNSVGGSGLPSQASAEEQRYRAVRLQARSGWGQWPSCSRRIGVR